MVQRRASHDLPLHFGEPASPTRRRASPSRRALGWLVRACIGALALKGLVTPLSEEAEVAPIRNSKRYKQTLPQRRSAALAPRKDADHLVVVAGHAVTMAESLDGVDALDSSWYLLDYQRRADVPSALVKHIEEGVRITARDPKSVLVFSGGQTRRDAGPRSKARATGTSRSISTGGARAPARARRRRSTRATRSRTCCSRRAASRKWSDGTPSA